VLAVLGLLPAHDLARCCAASRALLAFADGGGGDLWRAHVLALLDEEREQDQQEQQRPSSRRLRWRGGWRETYAASVAADQEHQDEGGGRSGSAKRPRVDEQAAAAAKPPPVLYSDLLHASRRCASLRRLPRRWLERETVDRVFAGHDEEEENGAAGGEDKDGDNRPRRRRQKPITRQEFVERYERPNLPVILTGAMDRWTAYRARSSGDNTTTTTNNNNNTGWTSLQALLECSPLGRCNQPVLVGNQPWPLREYARYAHENDDEMPLYLFDKRFVDKAPEMARGYAPPPDHVFGLDLFSLLPAKSRPDWRWLIAGPARSGSTFHVDPNATSAWNAVVSGTKRWVMFPPSAGAGGPPPGVHPSADGAEVATPVSILEWYFAFYEAAREEEEEGEGEDNGAEEGEEEESSEDEEEEEEEEEDAGRPSRRLASRRFLAGGHKEQQALASRPRRMYECTVRAGEILFVPRGWWHMALNLEEGVAVTQNFVSEETLPFVLRFLRRAADAEAGGGRRHASLAQDLVSGLEDLSARAGLYDRFVAVLRERAPEALARAQARLDEEDARRTADRKLAATFQAAPASKEAAAAAADADAEKPSNGFAFSFF
jgi:hypothetical protein